MSTPEVLEGPPAEVLFEAEITALVDGARTRIDELEQTLEHGHSGVVFEFWDSQNPEGFTVHAAMLKTLEEHGVLDEYLATYIPEEGALEMYSELNDGSFFMVIKSQTHPGKLLLSDQLGIERRTKNGKAIEKNIYGGKLSYRKHEVKSV